MDSRERRGGSEQVVCSGSESVVSQAFWGFRDSSTAFASRDPSASAHEDFVQADPAMHRTWSEYLMAGPSVWSHVAHPRLTPAIEASMWKSIRTDPPPTPARWSNSSSTSKASTPTRFDHYHPRVSRWLWPRSTRRAWSPQATTSTPTSRVTPPATTPLISRRPTPPAVPEPGPLLLTLGMAGYAVVAAAVTEDRPDNSRLGVMTAAPFGADEREIKEGLARSRFQGQEASAINRSALGGITRRRATAYGRLNSGPSLSD